MTRPAPTLPFARQAGVLALGASLACGSALLGCSEDRHGGGPLGAAGTLPPDPSQSGGKKNGGGGGSPTGSSCDYPKEPIGLGIGEIPTEDLSWEGFPEGATGPIDIPIGSYNDCEGDLESKALLVLQVAEWCPVCRADADETNGLLGDEWNGLGIRVLYLVSEDGEGEPADVATAARWNDEYGRSDNAVAADPDFTFSGGVHIFPQKILIDPRTMKIVDHVLGDVPIDEELEALLDAND